MLGLIITILFLVLLGLATAGWIGYVIVKTDLEFLSKRVKSLERTTDDLVNEETERRTR